MHGLYIYFGSSFEQQTQFRGFIFENNRAGDKVQIIGQHTMFILFPLFLKSVILIVDAMV